MDNKNAMVEVRNALKRYGSKKDGVLALNNVNVTINKNEFFTLLGPSGCGKTTLLRLIAGFEQPTAGDILLDGEAINKLPPFKRPVNTVFQNYSLFPHMTVAQNIAFGLEMKGLEKAEIDLRVEEMLALVKLDAYAQRKPSQLSGGQQQRIALARALANKPKVLLLDEPLSALDLKLRKEMQIELKRIQMSTGTTFIFVTHDQEEALTMSDRVAVMSAGDILQVGQPMDIYERPETQFVANFIGESNFLDATYHLQNNHFTSAHGTALEVVNLPRKQEKLEDNASVTLAIRPEKIKIIPQNKKAQDAQEQSNNQVSANVNHVVYMGTDTIYHLLINGKETVTCRVQNTDEAASVFKVGDEILIEIPKQHIQVLVS